MLINGFDSATISKDKKQISQAQICQAVLADDDRKNGDKNNTKHKKKPGKGKIHERHYGISNYNNNNPIPLKDCTFKTQS